MSAPETREIESLIHFWKDSLAMHRLLMSSSTIYLVEQTIKMLEELEELMGELKLSQAQQAKINMEDNHGK